MHFASSTGDDDYDEMWMKVINGSWLFRLSFSVAVTHAPSRAIEFAVASGKSNEIGGGINDSAKHKFHDKSLD